MSTDESETPLDDGFAPIACESLGAVQTHFPTDSPPNHAEQSGREEQAIRDRSDRNGESAIPLVSPGANTAVGFGPRVAPNFPVQPFPGIDERMRKPGCLKYSTA